MPVLELNIIYYERERERERERDEHMARQKVKGTKASPSNIFQICFLLPLDHDQGYLIKGVRY